jgi:hypothetical protein
MVRGDNRNSGLMTNYFPFYLSINQYHRISLIVNILRVYR